MIHFEVNRFDLTSHETICFVNEAGRIYYYGGKVRKLGVGEASKNKTGWNNEESLTLFTPV